MRKIILAAIIAAFFVACATSKQPCGDPARWEAKTKFRGNTIYYK